MSWPRFHCRLLFMGTTVKVIVSGIILWLVALVIEIARSAPTSQILICVAGAVLGLFGVRYSIKRLRREKIKG
jgi:Protein of unknown function (DUF2530)